MTLGDIIDRIYVINLPERRDRKAQISRELQRCGLDWHPERVICWPAHRPNEDDGFPSIGARGCFLSHLGALEHAQMFASHYVLILEDDAVLLPQLTRQLASLAELLRDKSPDLVYLGHCRIESGPMLAATPFQPCLSPVEGAHAYLVHTRVFPILLPYLRGCLTRPAGHPEGGRLHFDAALTLFRGFHKEYSTWLAYPALVEQRFSRSDIQPRWWYDSWPVVRTLAALARNLKQQQRHIEN